jgi:hypothetical protein
MSEAPDPASSANSLGRGKESGAASRRTPQPSQGVARKPSWPVRGPRLRALHAAASLPKRCACCLKSQVPGTLYPWVSNGDDTHAWVERCAECAVYDSNEAAAQAVAEALGLSVRFAIPLGSDSHSPYVEPSAAEQPTQAAPQQRRRQSALAG